MAVATFVNVTTSFLGAGPMFTIDLPAELSQMAPERVTIVDFGGGGRDVSFLPKSHDSTPDLSVNRIVQTGVSADGYPVEIYQRVNPPIYWSIKWDHPAGSIYTHVRDLEGLDAAQLVAAKLRIATSERTGEPSLLIGSPFSFAVSTLPGFQERIHWFPAADAAELEASMSWPVASVELMRPGAVASGEVQSSVVPGGYQARAGSQSKVDVYVVSGSAEPSEICTLATQIANSLVVAA
jgi:hypothetical protein